MFLSGSYVQNHPFRNCLNVMVVSFMLQVLFSSNKSKRFWAK